MKFSIIVVCLNPGEKLQKTVKSILMQTNNDYEILIKDGESTDGSLDFIKFDANEKQSQDCIKNISNEKIRVFSTKDSSIYDAMNQAVKLCQGEYYIFLNCGDEFENSQVLEKVSQYTNKSNKDIYYGDMKRQGLSEIVSSPRNITDFVCYRNIPCHQTCFYKNTLFKERAYDLKYPVRADYEHFLWCKYIKTAQMEYIPVTVCLYEGQGFSETKEHLKLAKKEHREITKKYIGSKCYIYKLIMILTLQPVRKCLSENQLFSKYYQKIKGMIYDKKKN